MFHNTHAFVYDQSGFFFIDVCQSYEQMNGSSDRILFRKFEFEFRIWIWKAQQTKRNVIQCNLFFNIHNCDRCQQVTHCCFSTHKNDVFDFNKIWWPIQCFVKQLILHFCHRYSPNIEWKTKCRIRRKKWKKNEVVVRHKILFVVASKHRPISFKWTKTKYKTK